MEVLFKMGENVMVSPQVTGEKDWIEAKIIEIEKNPFVGIVLVVETPNGVIFFEKEDMFRHIENAEICMQ